MNPQDAANVAAVINVNGSTPDAIAIGASMGRIIVTVARLDVNSVRKFTIATMSSMIKNLPSIENPFRLSPIQMSSPLDSNASANASPPPNNKMMPHGNRTASSQLNIPLMEVFPAGIKNKAIPPTIAMIVSSNPGIHFCKTNDLVIHATAINTNTTDTLISFADIGLRAVMRSAIVEFATDREALCNGNAIRVKYHQAK